ncbi:MAG: carbohydrate kinase, partial [Clostridia bacterium]|nr:carbohydrate kinase [Clostridia bacterium]
MADRFVLSFDIGTQSARAVLINSKGELVGKKQVKYDVPYESENPGWAEKDPDFYFNTIAGAARALKEEYPSAFEAVEGVTITSIRDSLVNVDKDGKPLRKAIIWIDSRMAEGSPVFSGATKPLLKVLGLKDMLELQYKKSQCNWIMEKQPEIWNETYKVMFLSGYLTYKLTGVMTDACACIVGHVPFDVKKRDWADKKALTRPIFDIPEEKLHKITESCEVMGYITEDCAIATGLKAGIPVIASGSDKACELIG